MSVSFLISFISSAHYTQLQRVYGKSFDLSNGTGVWVRRRRARRLTNQVLKRGVQGTVTRFRGYIIRFIASTVQ